MALHEPLEFYVLDWKEVLPTCRTPQGEESQCQVRGFSSNLSLIPNFQVVFRGLSDLLFCDARDRTYVR